MMQVRAVAAAMASFILVVACSGSDPVTEPSTDFDSGSRPEGSVGSSDSGATDSGVVTSTDSAVQSMTDAAPTAPATCKSPTMDGECKMPSELAAADFVDAWTTATGPGCNAKLHVLTFANLSVTVHRLALKASAPCELTYEQAVVTTPSGTLLAVDNLGGAYLGGYGGLLGRVVGGSLVTCAPMGAWAASSRDAASLTIAEDGSIGYVAMVDTQSTTEPVLLGKITPTATGCTVTRFAISGGTPIQRAKGLAIDSKGRLHVGDDDFGPDGHKRVVIYGADGSYVAAYDKGANNKSFGSVTGVTRSKLGMTVHGVFGEFGVSEDGVFRSEGDYMPVNGAANMVLRASSSGPTFFVADKYQAAGVIASILKDR